MFGLNPFKSKVKAPEVQYNEDIAAMVNDEYKRRQIERKPWELQWRLNIEFLNSNQYLDIDPVSQTILDIPRMYDYQEREVFNQIATIHETRCAKLTKQKPIMKTRPASSDDNDVSDAKISSMLLASSWQDQNMNIEYSNLVPWTEVCGTAFLKPVWSTRKGRTIGKRSIPDPNYVEGQSEPLDDEIQTPDHDQELGRGMIVETIKEGDIDTCTVPAFEIFPDSSWRNSQEQVRSMIHARAYHVDEIEDMWGVKVEPEVVDVMTLQQGGGTGGLGYASGNFRMGVTQLKNHAVLKEYYERPCQKYPQGRFIVVAGSKTLHVGIMPYIIGENGEPDFPFIRFVSIDHPGCYWGNTVIARCIPVQRRYNALRNRVAEYLNLVAIGQWYNPDGCLDEDSELNLEPGNIINYKTANNGAKPEPVQFPGLPVDFAREEQSLLAEFTSISGVSELSRYSQAPSGVKSGVALGITSDQDDTRIASTITNLANGIVMMGKIWLRLYKQNVQEPRMLRSVGNNREVEVQEWYVSQLNSDDIFIENSSALAETPSQRRQMVFDLMNAGLFARPEQSPFTEEARQKIFEMLDFGNWESGLEDMDQLQRQRAKKENHQFMTGQIFQPLPIQDFDDDAMHIDQHNRMRMSGDYDELMKSPQGQAINMLVIQHQQLHIQRHQQQQMAQQMQQILAQTKALPTAQPGGAQKSQKPA